MSPGYSHARPAITRVKLLVALAVVTAGAGIVISGVAKVREAARRLNQA